LHGLSESAAESAALAPGERLPSAWRLTASFRGRDPAGPEAHDRRVGGPEADPDARQLEGAGPWRTDRVPHARAIMRSLSPSDPCTEVTFVAGTQVTKTEIGNNFVGFVIDVAPAPMMMTLPTSNVAKRNSKTRLAKMIEAMPCLREKISENSRDSANSATLKQFPGGVLVIAGANSAAELKSQPVRFLFEDEVDEYPDDVDGQGPADELAEKRTDTYRAQQEDLPRLDADGRTRSRRSGSTGCARTCSAGTCRARTATATRCCAGKASATTRARSGPSRSPTAARSSRSRRARPTRRCATRARSSTPGTSATHCAARIDELHKQWMFDDARAKWIAERPHITRHQGYHLPSYYSPLGWFSWKEVVEKRLQADKDPTKALLALWHNTIAAEPYEDAGESVSDLELRKRAIEARSRTARAPCRGRPAAHRRGRRAAQAPRGEGQGLGPREGKLARRLRGDPRRHRDARALGRARRVPQEEIPARERRDAEDPGARASTRAFARRSCTTGAAAHARARARRCAASRRRARRARPPTLQDIDHNGKKIPNGIELWPIGTDTAKAEIYARLKHRAPGPGLHALPARAAGRVLPRPDRRAPGDPKYVKGYLKTSWEKDEVERNEPLDLEVYAYAAAIYAA
jgi:hypothetical protein